MRASTSSVDLRPLFASDATRTLGTAHAADLKLLQIFLTVVKAGGFSAATADLQMDLSAVSRQFKELEARVGLRLATRGREGFRLTEAGEQFLGVTQKLFAALSTFQQDLGGLAQAPLPTLRLGMVDALLTAVSKIPGHFSGISLPGAMRTCVDNMPGLAFQLFTLRPAEIEHRILTDELDAGIVAAHTPPARLEQHRLYSEPNSLYVAPDHPWYASAGQEKSKDQMAQVEWIADPYSGELPQPSLAGLLQGRVMADSIEGVGLLIATGRFVGFLPDHLVDSVEALYSLRRVCPGQFSYEQDIVLTCKQGNASEPLRQFLRTLTVQHQRHRDRATGH